MLDSSRRGFTIVEMLLVIAVISILITLVSGAAVSSIKDARERRSEVLANTVGMALATYRAQKGGWPDAIEKYARDGKSPSGSPWTYHGPRCPSASAAGADGLSAVEVDAAIRQVVEESGKNNPLIDASALVVASRNAAGTVWTGGQNGDSRFVPSYSFGEARRRGIPVGEMSFGYQRRKDGAFRRFRIFYDAATDSVKVDRWHMPADDEVSNDRQRDQKGEKDANR